MMTIKGLALIVIFVTNFRQCQSRKYDNYTLFNAVPTTMEHLRFLQVMNAEKYLDVIFWKHPHKLNDNIQFIINPNDLDIFKDKVKNISLSLTVLIDNVQRAFDSQAAKRYLRLQPEKMTWDDYHSLEDINQWLSDIAQRYPKIINLEVIGKSAEDRDIYAIAIKKTPGAADKVIVEGGVHGHEWVSVAFVTYLVNQIIHTNDSSTSNLRHVANNYHWILIPIVNPDGYDYTHKVDRLWRKNRKVYNGNVGVDLNRNFAHNFGKHDTSTNPKDNFYCGPEAFSESESKAVADVIRKHDRIKFFFSILGYGQKIILPFGDNVVHLDNYSEMENYARQAILKMRSLHNNKYGVGTTYDTLGTKVSGDSASWVKKNFKTKYVFTFLLRDNGSYGYALPSDQLESACHETLVGLTKLMTAQPRYVNTNLFDEASNTRGEVLMLTVSILFVTSFNTN